MAKVKFKSTKLKASYENGKPVYSNTAYNPKYTAKDFQSADRKTKRFIKKENKRHWQANNQQMVMDQQAKLAKYGTIGGLGSQAIGGRTANNVTDNISRWNNNVTTPQNQTNNKDEVSQETSNNSSDNVLGWIK